MRNGLTAAHHYEELTGRGTPAATAAGIVFTEHFAN
jgi:hypothetical protein